MKKEQVVLLKNKRILGQAPAMSKKFRKSSGEKNVQRSGAS